MHFVTLEPEEGSNGEGTGPGDGRETAKRLRSGQGVLLKRKNQELSLCRV